MTRLSFRSLVLFLALVVILLCGATTQPVYLQGTQLLPTFRMTFTMHQMKEIKPPNPAQKDEALFATANNATYFRSLFRQSPLLPGDPVSFKDQMVEWFLVPDPDQHNAYTARVYCHTCNPKAWVLMAINLGPPRTDLVARYNATLNVPPLPAPRPGSKLPVPPPPASTPIEWFLTSGATGQPAPASDQGYFAMFAKQGVTLNGVFYKQPYSMVGGGAGAWHQAYGQLVYDPYEIPQHVTPASFTPPSGYTQIKTPILKGGDKMVKENCSVCHMTGNGPTILFAPKPPPVPAKSPEQGHGRRRYLGYVRLVC